MSPKVSVVMAVYNGEPYLRESMESVLTQTFTNFECIVVDDGSTDRTPEVLAEYAAADQRIVLISSGENKGLIKSLNRALRVARGKYVARQDADDRSLPERFATQVEYLEHHQKVGLLATAYHVIDTEGRVVATHTMPLTDTRVRWHLLFHNPFCHSSVMFRRDLLAGGATGYECPDSEDYDLWARLLRRTRGENLGVPLVAYRAHPQGMTATRREQRQRIATRIAAGQLAELAPQAALSWAEVKTLRRWYDAFPKVLGPGDIALCRKLDRILAAFADKPDVDPTEAAQLCKRWRRRMKAAFLASSPSRGSGTSGLKVSSA